MLRKLKEVNLYAQYFAFSKSPYLAFKNTSGHKIVTICHVIFLFLSYHLLIIFPIILESPCFKILLIVDLQAYNVPTSHSPPVLTYLYSYLKNP